MKNIFIRFIGFIILVAFYSTATAQKVDSANKPKEPKVSKEPRVSEEPRVSKEPKIAKSYKQHDSLFTEHKKLFKHDSVYKVVKLNNLKTDSLYKKQKGLIKLSDSLQKLYTLVKYDSFKKIYAVSVKYDSLKTLQPYQVIKLDSIKKEIYLIQSKRDSLQLQKYLHLKNIQSDKIYKDSLAANDEYNSKKLSTEITCNSGDTVYINNLYRKVVIKNTASQRVRLSTTYYYKDGLQENDDKIFQKMGIGLSRRNNRVNVSVNGKKNSNAKIDGESAFEKKIAEDNERRPLQIEVPENTIVILNSKFAESNIEGFTTNLKADISNGSLRINNADYASIKSNYSTIRANYIKNADLNFSSTTFTASNIVTMSVVSNSSTIKLANSSTINMTSSRDEYRITKAISVSGNKNFGELEIENLKSQLILTGANAGIKINKIGSDSTFIKINNKYADLKLPLYNQENFSVYYEGSYNDMNKILTTNPQPTAGRKVTAKLSVVRDTLARIDSNANVNVNVNVNKTKFEAVAGDVSGRHTKVYILCPFCNVVFN